MAKAVTKLYKCLQTVRDTHGDMPIQQLAMLLRIGMYDGITMPELAKALGTTVASVSRHGKILGSFMDSNKQPAGFGYITLQPDIAERRRLACWLTPQGRAFIKQLEAIIDED